MKISTDISLSEDGDMLFDDTGRTQYIKQCVINRIKSVKSDWIIDNIGADIEQLVGMQNSSETGKRAESLILAALKDDNFLDDDEVYITCNPSSKYALVFDIMIKIYDEFVKIKFTLDIVKGTIDFI